MDDLSREICAVLEAWPVFQQAEQVLSYFPHRQEIDLRPLCLAHPEKTWFLPAVYTAQNKIPPTLTHTKGEPYPYSSFLANGSGFPRQGGGNFESSKTENQFEASITGMAMLIPFPLIKGKT